MALHTNKHNLWYSLFRMKIYYKCKTLFMQMSSVSFEFVMKN